LFNVILGLLVCVGLWGLRDGMGRADG
jgi:hypothetical protein